MHKKKQSAAQFRWLADMLTRQPMEAAAQIALLIDLEALTLLGPWRGNDAAIAARRAVERSVRRTARSA